MNVAYSARLFSPAMQLLPLQARSKSVAEALINGYLESARKESINGTTHPQYRCMVDTAEMDAHRIGSPWPRQRALVVDGKTLTVILDPRSGLTGPFLELTKMCSSVLACRATPLQKARAMYNHDEKKKKERKNVDTYKIIRYANQEMIPWNIKERTAVRKNVRHPAIMCSNAYMGK